MLEYYHSKRRSAVDQMPAAYGERIEQAGAANREGDTADTVASQAVLALPPVAGLTRLDMNHPVARYLTEGPNCMPSFAAMQLGLQVCNSGYRGDGFPPCTALRGGRRRGDCPFGGRKEGEFLSVSKDFAARSARDLHYLK